MNDEKEGFELHSVLSDVGEDSEQSTDLADVLNLVDVTIDTFLRFQMTFCASKLRDDISQWRAYTTLGRGVSIEFEDGFISGVLATRMECLYENDAKRNMLKREGGLLLNEERLKKFRESPNSITQYIAEVVKTLPRFKHKSFQPENEIRWIKSVEGAADPKFEIKYRPHRLGLATYVELPVDMSYIKSVTLGPQVPRQNLKTVEDFLIVNECSGFVTSSSSTLR